MKKQGKDTPTREDLNIDADELDPPQVIVSDGETMPTALKSLGYSEEFVKNTAKKSGLKINEIFIMTADKNGSVFIAKKADSKPIELSNNDKKEQKK